MKRNCGVKKHAATTYRPRARAPGVGVLRGCWICETGNCGAEIMLQHAADHTTIAATRGEEAQISVEGAKR